MPRVNLSDLNNYAGGGKFKKTNYLTLPNDGDSAQVHFLVDTEDELNNCIYVTHSVKLKSAPKLKYGVRVNCLREYNDPVENCPFCREGIATSITCAIPVFNVDTDQVEFWTRGKTEANWILRKMSKMKNFSSHLFEITRIGESGDQSTTYEKENLGEEELEDIEVPDVLGSVVLDKSADDMEYWIDEHDFPPEESDEEEEEAPRRRRPVKQEDKKRLRRPEPEDDDEDNDPPFDEDDEEEPPRRKATGRKVRRRTPEDEF